MEMLNPEVSFLTPFPLTPLLLNHTDVKAPRRLVG